MQKVYELGLSVSDHIKIVITLKVREKSFSSFSFIVSSTILLKNALNSFRLFSLFTCRLELSEKNCLKVTAM